MAPPPPPQQQIPVAPPQALPSPSATQAGQNLLPPVSQQQQQQLQQLQQQQQQQQQQIQQQGPSIPLQATSIATATTSAAATGAAAGAAAAASGAGAGSGGLSPGPGGAGGAHDRLPLPPTLAASQATLKEAVWLRIGALRGTMLDRDGALKAFEQVLAYNPRNVQAMTQAGAALAKKEAYPQAVSYLRRAITADPDCGEAWAVLAHCYVMTDELHQAYQAYQAALSHLPNPKDPNLWYGIGLLYDRYGSLENALEAFLAVLQIAPDFERAEEVCFCIGIIYKEQGKYDQSLEFFTKAVSASTPPPPLTRADTWYQIGHVHELKKDITAAIDTYYRALNENPNHSKSLQQLAWLRHQQGHSDDAVALLQRSTAADQADGQSWYLLGRVHMAKKDFRLAYEAYQQAVYRDHGNPTFWCSIGVLYYQMQQYRDAMDAYSRAIRINPAVSEVWYDLGTLYESCNQISDAVDAYRRAAELAPTNNQITQRLSLLEQSLASGVPPPPANPNPPQQMDQMPGMQQPSPQHPPPPIVHAGHNHAHSLQHQQPQQQGQSLPLHNHAPPSMHGHGSMQQQPPQQQLNQQNQVAPQASHGMQAQSQSLHSQPSHGQHSQQNHHQQAQPQQQQHQQHQQQHHHLQALTQRQPAQPVSHLPQHSRGLPVPHSQTVLQTLPGHQQQHPGPGQQSQQQSPHLQMQPLAIPQPPSSQAQLAQSVPQRQHYSHQLPLPLPLPQQQHAPLTPQTPQSSQQQHSQGQSHLLSQPNNHSQQQQDREQEQSAHSQPFPSTGLRSQSQSKQHSSMSSGGAHGHSSLRLLPQPPASYQQSGIGQSTTQQQSSPHYVQSQNTSSHTPHQHSSQHQLGTTLSIGKQSESPGMIHSIPRSQPAPLQHQAQRLSPHRSMSVHHSLQHEQSHAQSQSLAHQSMRLGWPTEAEQKGPSQQIQSPHHPSGHDVPVLRPPTAHEPARDHDSQPQHESPHAHQQSQDPERSEHRNQEDDQSQPHQSASPRLQSAIPSMLHPLHPGLSVGSATETGSSGSQGMLGNTPHSSRPSGVQGPSTSALPQMQEHAYGQSLPSTSGSVRPVSPKSASLHAPLSRHNSGLDENSSVLPPLSRHTSTEISAVRDQRRSDPQTDSPRNTADASTVDEAMLPDLPPLARPSNTSSKGFGEGTTPTRSRGMAVEDQSDKDVDHDKMQSSMTKRMDVSPSRGYRSASDNEAEARAEPPKSPSRMTPSPKVDHPVTAVSSTADKAKDYLADTEDEDEEDGDNEPLSPSTPPVSRLHERRDASSETKMASHGSEKSGKTERDRTSADAIVSERGEKGHIQSVSKTSTPSEDGRGQSRAERYDAVRSASVGIALSLEAEAEERKEHASSSDRSAKALFAEKAEQALPTESTLEDVHKKPEESDDGRDKKCVGQASVGSGDDERDVGRSESDVRTDDQEQRRDDRDQRYVGNRDDQELSTNPGEVEPLVKGDGATKNRDAKDERVADRDERSKRVILSESTVGENLRPSSPVKRAKPVDEESLGREKPADMSGKVDPVVAPAFGTGAPTTFSKPVHVNSGAPVSTMGSLGLPLLKRPFVQDARSKGTSTMNVTDEDSDGQRAQKRPRPENTVSGAGLEGLSSKRSMTGKMPSLGLPGLRSAPAPEPTTPSSALKSTPGTPGGPGSNSAGLGSGKDGSPGSPSVSKSGSDHRDRDSGSGSSRRGSAQDGAKPGGHREDGHRLSGNRENRDLSEEDRSRRLTGSGPLWTGRDRDRERERDDPRDREWDNRDRSRDRERDSLRDRERDPLRDRDRERGLDRDGHRDRVFDRDSHRDRDRDRDRDRRDRDRSDPRDHRRDRVRERR